jgi:4-amino-4-deoxy-L-arabinose transferase-like glycosyltransferase
MRDRAWWLLMLPLVASAWVRELWAPDEPRYAEVAREIYESGSFLVLHLCGIPWTDKPPLLFWASGLMGWLSDWSEPWLRLPSLAATFGTAWLVGRLAGAWWGERAARWAPALFLGTAMVTEIGGRLQVDPLLAFLGTLALYLVTRDPVDGRSKGRDVLLAGLSVGLAALTKGPVAWVNFSLVAGAWAWACPGSVPKLRVRTWLAVGLLALAPVGLWAVAVVLVEPALAGDLFFGQHLGRVIDVAERHPGPVWKHLLRMPGLLLPWTALVLAGLVHAVRRWRSRGDGLSRGEVGLIQAGLWLAVLLVFFSLIPPKRDLYLLPACPAAALLAAWYLDRALASGRMARSVGVATGAVVAVGGGALCAAAQLTDELPGLWWRGPLAGAPLLVAGLAAVVASYLGRVGGFALGILGGWVMFGVVLAAAVFAPMNVLKSPRAFAEELARRPERPAAIPCLIGVQPANYRFYGRVPTVRTDDLLPYLEQDGQDFLALATEDVWLAMDVERRTAFRLIASRSQGGKRILLLGAPRPGAG